MGTMPLSLEKGVIGLRLDYLTQFQSVRDHVRPRLENWLATQSANDHPAKVMSTIQVHGMNIDMLTDKKADFVKKINYLWNHEGSLDPEWHHYGDGEQYIKHDSALRPANQDATGNRNAFMDWWTSQAADNPALFNDIAQKIVDALNTNSPHVEYWWDCTIDHGAKVEVVIHDTVVRVLFRTDHTAVYPDPDLQKRDPDPEPSDPTEEYQQT